MQKKEKDDGLVWQHVFRSFTGEVVTRMLVSRIAAAAAAAGRTTVNSSSVSSGGAESTAAVSLLDWLLVGRAAHPNSRTRREKLVFSILELQKRDDDF